MPTAELSDEPESLPRLYEELKAKLDLDLFEDVFSICEEILTLKPTDSDALLIQCLCLIHQKNYAQALDLVSGSKNRLNFVLQRAYCMFRLNKLKEALVLCKNSKGKSDGILHVQAQILYKMGRYEEASAIYRELMAASPEDETCQTNLFAAYISGNEAIRSLAEIKLSHNPHIHELLYNAGTALALTGHIKDAIQKMEDAKSSCHSNLVEEGFSEEDILEESTLIKAQEAAMRYTSGQFKSSKDLFESILSSNPSDPMMERLVSANLIVVRSVLAGSTTVKEVTKGSKKGISEDFKRLRGVLSSMVRLEEEGSLVPFQAEKASANRCIAAAMTGIGEGSEKSTTELLDEHRQLYPQSAIPVTIKAYLQLRCRNYDECMNILTRELQMNEEMCQEHSQVKMKLMIAQVLFQQSKFVEAANKISEIKALEGYPGVASNLVYIYRKGENMNAAIEILRSFIKLWLDENSEDGHTSIFGCPSPEHISIALIRASQELLKHGYYSEAYKVLSYLLSPSSKFPQLKSRDRRSAFASCILAISHENPDQALEMLAEFQREWEVDRGRVGPDDGMSVENLEGFDPPKSGIVSRVLGLRLEERNAIKKAASQDPVKREKFHTKRREKFLRILEERGVIEAGAPIPVPDPERWLPIKQRSYMKRSRKRNKFGGMQGAGEAGKRIEAKLDVAAIKASASANENIAANTRILPNKGKRGRR